MQDELSYLINLQTHDVGIDDTLSRLPLSGRVGATDRLVILLSNGQAIWVNETWTEETEASGQIIGGLTLANGMIYVGTRDGYMYAVGE